MTGLAIIAGVGTLLAHHEVAAKFDPAKTRMLNGVVTSVDWANPHVHVLINVREGSQTANWAVELESPFELERSGWKRDSVKPGDVVTVQGPVARDQSRQVWGTSLTRGGQKILAMTPQAIAFYLPAANPQPGSPAPRWPDGKPMLGAAPGEIGYWARPSASGLKESGVNVEMDEHGLLKNINDAPKVAPFQPWARDLYVYRQRNFMKDDPMFVGCLPPGAVRQFQSKWGVQFLEEKQLGRIFVMAGGGNHDWHFIYTDGRPSKGAPDTLYYGNAIGKWDGDALIVESRGFNERFWFSNGGLPHTEQLHLLERFTRTDRNTLKYEVTIDDPGAYMRPWSAGWTLQWVANEDLPSYYCQDNRS